MMITGYGGYAAYARAKLSPATAANLAAAPRPRRATLSHHWQARRKAGTVTITGHCHAGRSQLNSKATGGAQSSLIA